MMYTLNNLAGRTLLLQHKLIEIFRTAPRFVSEYLFVEYEQKTIQKWSKNIKRQLIPISDLALFANDGQDDT